MECLPDRRCFPRINRIYKFDSSSDSSLGSCYRSWGRTFQTRPPSRAASEIWQVDLCIWQQKYLLNSFNFMLVIFYLPLWLIHWELNWATNALVSLTCISFKLFSHFYPTILMYRIDYLGLLSKMLVFSRKVLYCCLEMRMMPLLGHMKPSMRNRNICILSVGHSHVEVVSVLLYL